MKIKLIIPTIIATFLTGCNIESDNCPRAVEVPFERVEIPDSVKAGTTFTIDMRLHDAGCYQSADVYASRLHDTIYLSAIANYDECGCPKVSKNLELSYITSVDTSLGGTTKYFVYMQINGTKDSIQLRQDTIVIY